MSGLPSFLSSGAECSTGNPLDGLSKQFNKDRSLEQNRFIHGPDASAAPQQAFRQAFRSAQPISAPQNNQMARDFVKEFSDPSIGKMRMDPFNFNDMNLQLHHQQQLRAQASANTNWASEFNSALPQLHKDPQLSNFNAAFNLQSQPPLTVSNPQAASFNPAQSLANPLPMQIDPMANAFNSARLFAGQSGYYINQQPSMYQVRPNISDNSQSLNSSSQDTSQINDEQDSDIIIDTDIINAARSILNATNHSFNNKFNSSEFISLMTKISDSNVSHQTPRIVELPDNATTNTTAAKPADSTSSEKVADSTINLESGNIFNPETATSLEKNWSEEFEKTLDGPLAESFVPGSIEDLENQIDSNLNSINPGVEFEDSMKDIDEWARVYKESISSMLHEPDADWEQQSKAWSDHSRQLYRASDPKFDSYSFFSSNPFANVGAQPLSEYIEKIIADPIAVPLSDTILALEASLQKDPMNAKLWTLLGIKQQENEREEAAIAALRKAISIDPNATDAYMAIAASYTNENYFYDAYHALLSWISKHPEYASLVPADSSVQMDQPETTKTFVQDLYLKAARSRAGNNWDPDVQIGLGILFNISEEYSKAIDCFRAALSKRPSDYVTWNKLGASMANSQDPKSATEAYFHALELQPSYIRTRFNLAIASMNMHHHKEAAEHLLGAISLQKQVVVQTPDGPGDGFVPASSMSNNLWETLRMLMSILGEPQLADAALVQDLDAFRAKFEF
ncbi:hypothetical protein BB560_007040 [Smittium megazygosporum]|uniref:Uncharacterized protein n=1 Tax=Smittium megazygosporum TaxID=133381 RepID=A0A2T9XZ39_9FUNG|nr:hypothetical protein BB560_007040 [Smittium megazygosporum]